MTMSGIQGVNNNSANKLLNLLDLNGDGIVSKQELQTIQQKLQQQGIKTPFLDSLIQNMNNNNSTAMPIPNVANNTTAPVSNLPLSSQLGNTVGHLLQFAENQISLVAQGKGLYPVIQKLL